MQEALGSPISPAPTPSQEVIKLRDYLDSRGINYRWLTDNLGLSPAWFSRIVSGEKQLTDERKKQIEELLNIQL